MGTRFTRADLNGVFSFEINDSLVLTREQGFPTKLKLERHQRRPYTAADFQGRTFRFSGKPGRRLYQMPPVRCFLVEDRDGKWIYWGRILMTKPAKYHPIKKETSGEFEIIYIYTPEEMKIFAHRMIDGNPKTDYFGALNHQ